MASLREKRKYANDWYYANKEKHTLIQKRYKIKHKDEIRLRLAPKKRDRNLKVNYGISSKEYDVMFIEQKGLCAICGQTSSRHLSVDHNHKTGKIRGLLCNTCNRALGLYSDSIENLTKAIQYLSCHA